MTIPHMIDGRNRIDKRPIKSLVVDDRTIIAMECTPKIEQIGFGGSGGCPPLADC